jgi:hypothetical protein
MTRMLVSAIGERLGPCASLAAPVDADVRSVLTPAERRVGTRQAGIVLTHVGIGPALVARDCASVSCVALQMRALREDAVHQMQTTHEVALRGLVVDGATLGMNELGAVSGIRVEQVARAHRPPLIR